MKGRARGLSMRMTSHAKSRLYERFALPIKELRYLFERNLYYPLGISDNKEHRLIYSEPDDQCLIAVYDTYDKEVVTVLPVDYHTIWHIDLQVLEDVKNEYLKAEGKEIKPLPPIAPEVKKKKKKKNQNADRVKLLMHCRRESVRHIEYVDKYIKSIDTRHVMIKMFSKKEYNDLGYNGIINEENIEDFIEDCNNNSFLRKSIEYVINNFINSTNEYNDCVSLKFSFQMGSKTIMCPFLEINNE